MRKGRDIKPARVDNDFLANKSKWIRRKVLEIVSASNSSHVGGMLSVVDIMAFLFYEGMDFTKENYNSEVRDRFILSKGHASLVLYAILCDKGIITARDLDSYCKDGGCLMGHTCHKVEGVEVSTGSLGHGLPIAAGLALAKKIDGLDRRVYCLIGDGECNEGSIWESLIFISNSCLRNLVVIVDANRLQAYDFCEKILPASRLIAMLKSTGLNFYEIDGHSFDKIRDAFEKTRSRENDKAHVIFAHTVKGKGVSFMENKLEWHYKSPNPKQLEQALRGLE